MHGDGLLRMEDHNRQRKVAAINDFSGFGRCSLTVALPILSAMKIQCCPVPTAIFTNHTGFPSYAWTDCTDHLDDYVEQWKRLDLRFSAISTGFLGSRRQIDFVFRFIEAFRTPDTLVLVDPVMGDYGRLYSTYDDELAKSMRAFLDVADVLTPNLTEACVLADRPYSPDMTDGELEDLCDALAVHAKHIVISGIARGDDLVNYVYEKGSASQVFSVKRIGADRSGTGDVFVSALLGSLLNGASFIESVRRAALFVSKAVARSEELGIPTHDGLAFEEVLSEIVA